MLLHIRSGLQFPVGRIYRLLRMGTSKTQARRRLYPQPADADRGMPLDTDTKKDDLVNRGSFSKLVNMAASIPRMYGYVSTDVDLYKTEDEKD